MATANQLYQVRYGNQTTPSNVAQVQSIPAPVGGWNARDSLANMDPMDAVTMVNLWPHVSSVQLRGGFSRYATGLSGEVQSLLTYNGAATSELWAFTASGDLCNASAAGAVPAATLSSLGSGYWEYSNIATAGGNYMVAVDGVDPLLLYNGTSWASITGVSTPAITGVTTSTLNNVCLHKNRLWFLQKNTLKAWYLPTSSIAGAASAFDLSAVARKGGYLVDVDTWTIDAGYGVDDNLVFITSEGECIVYAGTDPASASTWSLIGVWQLGAPIGPRCMLKWAGDLLILTYDGLIPLASALQSSRLDPRVALSDKIQGAISAATDGVSNAPAARGWEVFYYARQNALWINVPVATDQEQQYAMNTITKSWTQFTGWPSNCWALYNDKPYFGGPSYIGNAWDSTYADNGAAIPTQCIQAFNYFDTRGVKKYFTRIRPSIFTDGVPAISVGMNVDFDLSNTTAPLSFVSPTYGLWDTATWDSGIWGQGLVVTNAWLGVTGIGYCGGIQMQTASMGMQIQWASTDVVFQSGWGGV